MTALQIMVRAMQAEMAQQAQAGKFYFRDVSTTEAIYDAFDLEKVALAGLAAMAATGLRQPQS